MIMSRKKTDKRRTKKCLNSNDFSRRLKMSSDVDVVIDVVWYTHPSM